MKKISYFSFCYVILVCVFLYANNLKAESNNDSNGYRIFASAMLSEDNDGTINYTSTIYNSILPLKVSNSKGTKICTGVAVSDTVILTAPLCVSTNDTKSVKVIKKSNGITSEIISPIRIYTNSLYKANNNKNNALVALVFEEGSFSDFIEVAAGFLEEYVQDKNKEYNVSYIGYSNSKNENDLSLKVKKAAVNQIYNDSYTSPFRIGFPLVKNGVTTTQKFVVESADIGAPLLLNGKVVGITSDIVTALNKNNQSVTYPIWTYINDYKTTNKNNNYNFLFSELHNLASIAGITPGIQMIEFFGVVKVLDLHPRYSYGPLSECDNCNLNIGDSITGLRDSRDSNRKIYFISPSSKNYDEYRNNIITSSEYPVYVDTVDLNNPLIIYKESALPIQMIRHIWKIATYSQRKHLPWILNQDSSIEERDDSIFKPVHVEESVKQEYSEMKRNNYFESITPITHTQEELDALSRYAGRSQQVDTNVTNQNSKGFIKLSSEKEEALSKLIDQHLISKIRTSANCKILPSIDNKDVFYKKVLPFFKKRCSSSTFIPLQCRIDKEGEGNYLEYHTMTASKDVKFKSNNLDILFLTCADDIEKIKLDPNPNQSSVSVKCSFNELFKRTLYPGTFLDQNKGDFRCSSNNTPVPAVLINQIIDF